MEIQVTHSSFYCIQIEKVINESDLLIGCEYRIQKSSLTTYHKSKAQQLIIGPLCLILKWHTFYFEVQIQTLKGVQTIPCGWWLLEASPSSPVCWFYSHILSQHMLQCQVLMESKISSGKLVNMWHGLTLTFYWCVRVKFYTLHNYKI